MMMILQENNSKQSMRSNNVTMMVPATFNTRLAGGSKYYDFLNHSLLSQVKDSLISYDSSSNNMSGPYLQGPITLVPEYNGIMRSRSNMNN